jgi:lysozyme family protein
VTPIDEIVGRVLMREGGVADVGDGKGVTRYGQTPSWLEQFSLPLPKTSEEAAANYVTWAGITGLDKIVMVADDLADIVCDIAVMSSAPKAIKALQQVLHVTVDGALGPQTLAALAVCDRGRMARAVIALDMEYQGRLVTLDPTRARYAAGWAMRMAGHVRNLV